MEPKPQKNIKVRFILLTVFSSVLLLGGGIVGMQILASMKTPPARKVISEKPLQVETVKAKFESITPYISGYGEVKAVEVVSISPEIQGKVVDAHPRLEIGEQIGKGETLIRIDTRDDDLSMRVNRKRLIESSEA